MKNRSNGVYRIRHKSEAYGNDWNQTSNRLKAELGRICVKCGHTGSPSNKLNSHHVVKRSRLGTDSEANIVILCEACHSNYHRHMRRR